MGGSGIDNAGKVVCSAYLDGGEDEAEGRSRFASGLVRWCEERLRVGREDEAVFAFFCREDEGA